LTEVGRKKEVLSEKLAMVVWSVKSPDGNKEAASTMRVTQMRAVEVSMTLITGRREVDSSQHLALLLKGTGSRD
jgi:Ribonuclease G/E